jgi:hypothetical protein
MFGSFPPSLWLVCASKVYSGLGADIVYGIITLIDPAGWPLYSRAGEEWRQMNVPEPYNEVRRSLRVAEVNFGIGGIKLFSLVELDGAQIGYSVAPDGKPLWGNEPGAWQASWVVIGYETGCGDPLFIDTHAIALPVFTAIHGEGEWEPFQIASSFEVFARCVEEFSRIAIGRSNPVELAANPVRDDERSMYLRRIAEMNQSHSAPEFWDVLLGY